MIPLLGVWDSPDEINFDKLPEQFVLKVNWGSEQNIIVKDKSKLNKKETKRKLKEWMNKKIVTIITLLNQVTKILFLKLFVKNT